MTTHRKTLTSKKKGVKFIGANGRYAIPIFSALNIYSTVKLEAL